MLPFDLFVALENFSLLFWILGCAFIFELGKVGISGDKVWVVVQGVQNDMKESNGPTGILSILLHVEDILWDSFNVKGGFLSFFEIRLNGSNFITEHDPEYGFREHFLSPFLNGKHLLEVELIKFEAHLPNELVDDIGIGFKWHPVVFFLVHF